MGLMGLITRPSTPDPRHSLPTPSSHLLLIGQVFHGNATHGVAESGRYFDEDGWLVGRTRDGPGRPDQKTEEELQEPVNRLIEEGGADMQTIFDKWIEKGKWDVVMNLLRDGLSIDFISRATGFTAAQINEFKEKMKDQQVNAAA